MVLALLLAASPAFDCGPMKVRVVRSEAAQSFHVVDQLSAWSQYCHGQYRRWFSAPEQGGLSEEDQRLLATHASLRKRTDGWGKLDAFFNVEGSTETALLAAQKAGLLTNADLDNERRLFEAFGPRIRSLTTFQQPALDRFAQGIEKAVPELTRYGAMAAHFWEGTTIDVPVFLVPTPSGGSGGGYSRGSLVVEVSEEAEPTFVLEHELWHAFAEPHGKELHAAAEELGTDFETVSEGLAYAVAPGIFRPKRGDALAKTVATDSREGASFSERPYVRFNRLGLALRPTLEVALRGNGTFQSYLPVEKAVYRGLAEVATAVENAKPTPRCFWFGPSNRTFGTTLSGGQLDVWSRPMKLEFLEELRPKIRPHDFVMLGLVGNAGVPSEFAGLLGRDAEALAKQRGAEPSGEARFDGPNGETVVVFWAPDEKALFALAIASKLRPTTPPQ